MRALASWTWSVVAASSLAKCSKMAAATSLGEVAGLPSAKERWARGQMEEVEPLRRWPPALRSWLIAAHVSWQLLRAMVVAARFATSSKKLHRSALAARATSFLESRRKSRSGCRAQGAACSGGPRGSRASV
eukprot:8451654-Lingulodinium_polyedra.AAC.1